MSSNEGTDIYIHNLKTDFEKDFIRELRRQMLEHKLTHEQLAHICGKSRSAITKWLTGQAGLMMTDALLLMDFFHMKELKKIRLTAPKIQEPENAA